MLVLARESRRMTQIALARASSTSQAAISKAEAALAKPHDESILAWAKALRYRADFFGLANDAPPMPRTFFRKKASLSQTDIKAIKASIAIQCHHVKSLARSVDLPEPDVPTLCLGGDIPSATEAARWVRSKWRLPQGPIPNLSAVLEDHSILIVPMQGDVEAFDGLSVFEPKHGLPPIMFIRANAPADRARRTMAHELGHIVLHHHECGVSEECEDEADEFASEFLMPANDIRHQFSSRTRLDDLAQLKLHWRVSMQTLLMRAEAIGRVTRHQASILWKQIGALGYRRNEPNTLKRETPSLLNEMVRVHVEDLGYDAEGLCVLLSLEFDEVLDLYKPDVAPAVSLAPATSPRTRLRLV